jgi:hypothetical protein
MRRSKRMAVCLLIATLAVPTAAAAQDELGDVADHAADFLAYGRAGTAGGVLVLGSGSWSLDMSSSDAVYGIGSLSGSGGVVLVPGVRDTYRATGSGSFYSWNAPEITWSLPDDAGATGFLRLSYDVPQTGGGTERRTLHGVLHAGGWWLGTSPPGSFVVRLLYTSP